MIGDEEVSNRRRVYINKALARAQSLGIQVDADLRFTELLEKWAHGQITIKEAREAYLDHMRERDQAGADWRALGIASSVAKATAALAKGQPEG